MRCRGCHQSSGVELYSGVLAILQKIESAEAFQGLGDRFAVLSLVVRIML